jgi:hypothetical protein
MRRRGWLAFGCGLAACGDGATPAGPPPLVLVGDPTVTKTGTLVTVAGRVKNQAQRPYTAFVVVTLFGADGAVVGVCNGAVNDVPPGEEVTYQAVSAGAVTAPWARVEARVQNAMPR